MRQLVTDTPYYSPQESAIDLVRVDGRLQPTVVSARELDLGPVGEGAESWINRPPRLHARAGADPVLGDRDRRRTVDPACWTRVSRSSSLGSTSGTNRGCRKPGADANEDEDGGRGGRGHAADGAAVRTSNRGVAVGSRRHPPARGRPPRLRRRTAGPLPLRRPCRNRALELGASSRVRARPGQQGAAALRRHHLRVADPPPPGRARPAAHPGALHPLGLPRGAADRRTARSSSSSTATPRARTIRTPSRVDLGGASATYARASVRATVDAFSGQVDLYLTDPSEPIARAWAETFPTLFRAADEMPAELRDRLRYPRRPLRRPGHGVRDVPHHPTRPLRERCRRVVATDRTVRAHRGRRRRRLRRVGRGRPPAHHAARVHVHRRRPGSTQPRLVLETYYAPRSGQNLVATLSGWIDDARAALDWPPEPSARPGHPGPRPDQSAGLRDAARQQPAGTAEPRDP